MKRPIDRFFVLFAALWLVTACGESRAPSVLTEQSFLVVVEYDVYHDISESLESYAEGLERQGVEVHVEPWAPGTFEELRAVVFRYVDEEKIDGALLVGSLPAAWYEQRAFKMDEKFPTDIVLQDRDAVWTDADDNGVFDAHTPLDLDLYVSRIQGSPEELREYFDRVDYYRHVGSLVNVAAFVFVDDDWRHRAEEQSEYLDFLYGEVLVLHEPADTTLERYLAFLTFEGAEFVYQASHSTCSVLEIEEDDVKVRCTCYDIVESELRASFLNLFNCSAARFTETAALSLADAYVMGTGYGLATVGSTKMGAIWDSRLFHKRLAEGRTWGSAYLDWYNEVGVHSDTWHLGIVLMGDPLLRLHPETPYREPPALSTPWSQPPEDSELMEEIAATMVLGSYEEYRQAHPEFFQD